MSGELRERITNYLASGGLFNPEMAIHEKVRDLLIECREELEVSESELSSLRSRLASAEELADKWDEEANRRNRDGAWCDAAFAECAFELRSALRAQPAPPTEPK